MNSISLKLGKPSHTALRNTKPKPSVRLWRRISLLAVAMAVVTSGIVVPTQAAPGDYVWEKANTNLTGDKMEWSSLTSSNDGTRLAAVTASGYIFTSTDSGASWTERTVSEMHGS